MVDSDGEFQSRIHRLSDSSQNESSDDESESNASIPLPHKFQDRCRRSNIRELRDEFDDDPDLYGIRRSVRSKKEPYRYTAPPQPPASKSRRRLVISSSESSDDDYRPRARSGIRTRGNRISYQNAFNDKTNSSDSDEEIQRNQERKKNFSPLHKRRGPLVRTSKIHRLRMESMSSNECANQLDQTNQFNGDDEVDTIEEVLTHALRRKSAVGNQTTLYNCRTEKDPNQGFNPETEPGDLQFLIKWKNWSHIHSTWESMNSLNSPDRSGVDGLKKLHAYKALIKERERQLQTSVGDEMEALIYEEERNLQIIDDKMCAERIVAHSRDPHDGGFDYLTKWKRLDYRFCTWESGAVIGDLFPSVISDYESRNSSTKIPNKNCPVLYQRPRFVPLISQPDYLGSSDLALRDYQLEGINWMVRAWCRGNSVILADEMGLGKTIQTVGFVSYLFHTQRMYGPYLFVVPLSTISSWQHETSTWASDLNVIIYTGDHISRQLIREYEWFASSNGYRRQNQYKFNVCITTYEILLKDKSWLGSIPWVFLAVDEAHRLKNDQSQLYKALQCFNTNSRLLITGTPLQNSMRELWALLQFIMPDEFDSWEEFETTYSVTDDIPVEKVDDEVFHNLHKVLKPYLLRRMKKDVEASLPEKTEQILRVPMTQSQANIYRLILARNYDGLMKVTRGHKASFVNIVMELKKCCNHSHLIAPPSGGHTLSLDSFIMGSGKMLLLDKLLQRLKQNGHRVLIFSQMVRMLDIIADYLLLRGWGFQRLDGSIRSELRKQALDHFNAVGSTDFCFLLSTRAGGLGINLATADTVVIFDSDWNPQNDLQAQARAHRIGQTKQVVVYRLVTQSSVEEKIIESATRKMVLDHLVIQRMDTTGKRGLKKNDNSKSQLLTEILRYGAENLFKQEDNFALELDIDDVLKSAETRDVDSSSNCQANALLSNFKTVTLDNPDDKEHSEDLQQSWASIIPEDLRQQVKEEESQNTLVSLELGPRRRRQVKSYQAGVDSSSENSSDDADAKYSLSPQQIRALVRAIKRFPRPCERIESIAVDAELIDVPEDDLKVIVNEIVDGCKNVIKNNEDDDKQSSKGPVFEYSNVSIVSKPVVQSLEQLDSLHVWMSSLTKSARLDLQLPFTPKSVSWTCPWDTSDDVRLLAGVFEHGYDNWDSIKLDAEFGLTSKLMPVGLNERPQSNHLRTRVDYLLRTLSKSFDKQNETNEPPKKRKRTAKDSKKVASSQAESSIFQPKSAEFVDSDESSSDPESGPPSRKRTKSDTKTNHSSSKRKFSTPLHYTASQPPMPISETDGFAEMRGPVFLQCKEKLKPIKKHLRSLEHIEDSPNEDKKLYGKVIYDIGSHIHHVLAQTNESSSRHDWKSKLWDFVKLFSKRSVEELRRIYKHAEKKHKVPHEDKSRSDTHTSHHHPDASSFKTKHRQYENTNRPFMQRDKSSSSRFDNAFNRPPSYYGQTTSLSSYDKHNYNDRHPGESKRSQYHTSTTRTDFSKTNDSISSRDPRLSSYR